MKIKLGNFILLFFFLVSALAPVSGRAQSLALGKVERAQVIDQAVTQLSTNAPDLTDPSIQAQALAEEDPTIGQMIKGIMDDVDISGHVQTLNFFTQSSGSKPEMADNPLDVEEEDSILFKTANRVRLKVEWEEELRGAFERLKDASIGMTVEYDQRFSGGSYVGRGDFRLSERIRHDRQFLDLSQTFVEGHGAHYEQALYRAYAIFKSNLLDVKIGRQLIPWGLGRFKTATDVFNPFDFTQLEWDERDGVDALNMKTEIAETKIDFVFTPRGSRLHPSRYMTKLTRDVGGYEASGIWGFERQDVLLGYELQGNLGDAAMRTEFLYTNPRRGEHFIRTLLNFDYHFASGIYALIEYFFNGAGRQNRVGYDWTSLIRGDIQEVGINYLGLQLGYDITPLIRIENNVLMNLGDQSILNRAELSDELRENLLLNLVSIVKFGNDGDEFGEAKNLFFLELEQSF